MDMNVPAKPRMPPIENFADTGPVGVSTLVVQHPPAASGSGRAGAHGGVARRHERHSRREGCGHDASLGQRGRLAHMPTAATAAGLRGLILGRDGDGSASNYETARRGPTHGVHFSPSPNVGQRCLRVKNRMPLCLSGKIHLPLLVPLPCNRVFYLKFARDTLHNSGNQIGISNPAIQKYSNGVGWIPVIVT